MLIKGIYQSTKQNSKYIIKKNHVVF